MKTILILGAMLVAMVARGQFAVMEWKTAATKKYPALAVEGSEFNQRFVEKYNRYKTELPEILVKEDWPMRVADLVQEEVQRGDGAIAPSANFLKLKALAEKGDANAADAVGLLYREGVEVPKSTVDAELWFKRAAEANLAAGQFHMARAYWRGELPFAQDKFKAYAWYRKSAEQGYGPGENMVGRCYQNGEGVQQNEREGLRWLLKAVDHGNVLAINRVGVAYHAGWGADKNFTVAARYYQMAADLGDAAAQSNLGFCYEQGEGVPHDIVLAYKWLNLAASQRQEAKNEVAELEKQMSKYELVEAQRLCREFRPQVAKVADGEKPSGADKNVSKGTGSGFFISKDGYAFTNAHVVKGGDRFEFVIRDHVVEARLVKVDFENDVALLKAEGSFSALPVIPSRTVRLGNTVATVGFPNPRVQGFSPKLTKGEIGSLSGIQDDARYFQISVPIQPGNSGGALVDERGNVVGIVTLKLKWEAGLATAGTIPENVNYAVKSSYLLSLLESVPEVGTRLLEPVTNEAKFEDVVKTMEDAAVLVVVY